MSDESSFGLMLLLLILSVAATWAFSDQIVAPNHIQWAEDNCATNGGLERLSSDIFDLHATCANGAVFESGKPGPQQVNP